MPRHPPWVKIKSPKLRILFINLYGNHNTYQIHVFRCCSNNQIRVDGITSVKCWWIRVGDLIAHVVSFFPLPKSNSSHGESCVCQTHSKNTLHILKDVKGKDVLDHQGWHQIVYSLVTTNHFWSKKLCCVYIYINIGYISICDSSFWNSHFDKSYIFWGIFMKINNNTIVKYNIIGII